MESLSSALPLTPSLGVAVETGAVGGGAGRKGPERPFLQGRNCAHAHTRALPGYDQAEQRAKPEREQKAGI